jgi:ABC-type spermidine/putrescine transport system permease subunit I
MSRVVPWFAPMLPGLALFLVAYVPSLALILFQSFETHIPGQNPVPVLTFENYVQFLSDSYYLGLLLNTVTLSATATFIAVVIAYPIAYAVVRSPRLRQVLLPILALSFFVSSIVRFYGWLGILGRSGPLNELLLSLGVINEPIALLYTETAVVIGLADFVIPYVALTLAGAINNVDESLEQAAQNLGATGWQTFLRVTLPLTFPGLLAALVLAFAINVSAVVTPVILGGGRVAMLGTEVYSSMLVQLNYPFASASVVVIVLTILALRLLVGAALKTRVVR